MKLPMPAPTISELLDEQHTRLGDMLALQVSPEVNGKYEHWDTLRHRDPPAGLSPRLWWLGIKFARSNIARTVPLQDKSGHEFRIGLTDSMQRRLHYIDREASGSIQGMEGGGQGLHDRFLLRSLIEESMTSSQLEGASTTRAVAKEMLSTGRAPRDRSEQMIHNNYLAMREVRELRGHKFTPERIMSIHRMLTAGTLDQEADVGRLRTGEDNIVVYDRGSPPTLLHVPPSASELPHRLQRLCDFANDLEPEAFLHPVVRAIVIHFQMGYDHPFCDGNGRTARVLFYWSMLNAGYWMTEHLSISSILKKQPGKYLKSYLYTESDERDLGYFVACQLEVIEKAIEGFHGYVLRKAQESRRAELLLKSPLVLGENLNHRQRALLAKAIRDPDKLYTIAGHQAAHRITYPTALNDLNVLESIGLLKKRKIGKAYHFDPVPDLAKRLS